MVLQLLFFGGNTVELTAAPFDNPQAPTPSTCSVRGTYHAPSGCAKCVSKTSPFTKNYGGVLCYNPTTLSSRSTVCTAVVLPAFVRDEASKKNTRSCIPPTQQTVNIFLVRLCSGSVILRVQQHHRVHHHRLSASACAFLGGDRRDAVLSQQQGATGSDTLEN